MKKILLISLVTFFAYAVAVAAVDVKYYETTNSHKDIGTTCVDCHNEKSPVAAPDVSTRSAGCISCHGALTELAKTTSKVAPNPHDTHMGRMDCYECHNVHKPSANMCSSCHTFTLNVK